MVCMVGSLNGTRCRDGVKVLWCHSHQFGWFFRLPSLHALVFIQKTFCDLIVCVCVWGIKENKNKLKYGFGRVLVRSLTGVRPKNVHVFLLCLSVLLTQSYDLFPILCSDVQYNESSVMHVNKNPDVIFMHSKRFS